MPWALIAWAALLVALYAGLLLHQLRPEDSTWRDRYMVIFVACLGVGGAASYSAGKDQGFESRYNAAMYHLASVPIRAAIIELAPYRRDLSQHTTDSSASTP